MEVYVNLKLFRLEHNQMHQDELAKILGIDQSSLSRMEKMYRNLDELQYKRLVEKFGEDDVKQYVTSNPLENAENKIPRRRPLLPETSSNLSTLTEVIKSQQEEIVRLNARVAELTDLLLMK